MGLSRSHMKVYLGGISVTQLVLLKSVVLCAAIGTGDPNTTINPGLVNVDSAATLIKNLKSQFEPPANRLRKFGRDWPSSINEPI